MRYWRNGTQILEHIRKDGELVEVRQLGLGNDASKAQRIVDALNEQDARL
jgi:hypothetical protein